MENKALEQKVLKHIDDNCDEMFKQLSGYVKIDTQNFYSRGGEVLRMRYPWYRDWTTEIK